MHMFVMLREMGPLMRIHTPGYVCTCLISHMFAFDVPTLRSWFDDLLFSYPTDHGTSMSSTFTAELKKRSSIQTRLV